MTSTKILIIGHTGLNGIPNVSWEQIKTVNIVDFDTVIVNTRSLSKEFLATTRYGHFDAIKRDFSRLLISGGEIVVLAEKPVSVDNKSDVTAKNNQWSPLTYGVSEETGDTIEVKLEDYAAYLSHLKKWDLLFYLPSDCLSKELTALCGDPSETSYTRQMYPIRINRYDRNIAVTYQMSYKQKNQNVKNLGLFTLLPPIPNLDDQTALNLILEHFLGPNQISSAPAWAEKVSMSVVDALDLKIEAKLHKLRAIQSEIDALSAERKKLDDHKKLLYATGPDLEKAFAEALRVCGGRVVPARYSQEEFVLEFGALPLLIECKGVSKSISLTHTRQLMDYLLRYEEEEGKAGKGILFGNAWLNADPDERDAGDTPMFPDNVVERATQLGIGLVSSVKFFNAFCKVLSGELAGSKILERLQTGIGQIKFDDL